MKILIVDDDRNSQNVLRQTFASAAFETKAASDGLDALQKLEEFLPDLIISDALMPRMDGFALCRRCKTDPRFKDIPFLFLTATYLDARDEQFARELGVARYLTKPQLPEDLIRIVQEVQRERAARTSGVQESAPLPEEAYRELHAEVVSRKLEQKIAELENVNRMLKHITDNVGEGIYVFDADGKVTFMNPEAERMLGWTREEMNKYGAHALIHHRRADGSRLPYTDCRMHNVAITGDSHVSTDEVFVRKDGTVFPIAVITTPIREQGAIIASVTAFQDITDRKKIEAERDKLIADLMQSLARVKTLSGLLPICASCKKIRDDKGYWTQIEAYIRERSEAEFSHGMCPDCADKFYKKYNICPMKERRG